MNMSENNIEQKKLNILKELLVSEEHSIEDFKRLVEKAKPFIKIENKTGKVILSSDFPLKVSDKIILFLVGTYFSKELGMNLDMPITSRHISENIGISQTTISGPLGEFFRDNIVSKDDSSYSIKYYEIEKLLDGICTRYLSKKEPKTISKLEIENRKIKKQRKKETKSIDFQPLVKRTFDENLFEKNINKYNLNKNEINSIFNFNGKSFVLLRGFKSTNNLEAHLKSTLLSLVANRLYFESNDINSSELRKILKNSGVPNLTPLSSNLKNYPTLLIHKRGPIGSTKTSYEITEYGFQKGITLIRDILDNTSNFDIDIQSRQTRIKSQKAPSILIEKNKLLQNISEFTKNNEIDENKLKTTFDFQPDGLRLLVIPKAKNRKKLQIKSLMLLGIVVKKIYQIDSFDSKNILKESHISYDRLDLLDSNKDYKKYFSASKSKSAMQLKYPGEVKSIEMLKEFIKTEDCKL